MSNRDRPPRQTSDATGALRLVNPLQDQDQDQEVTRWREIYEQLLDQQSLPAAGIAPREDWSG